MKLFHKCSRKIKAVLVLAVAFFIVILSELIAFHESKFIGVIVFGYLCYRMWGEDKPEHELAQIWLYFMPFLFGSVGASIRLDKINGSDIWKGLIVITIGVSFRWIGAFFATWKKLFTLKERAFMGFAWIPKATVQAAIGGIVLETALVEGIEEYITYGEAMLTTAVFAVIITAPLGAILTNTLGPMWLEKKIVVEEEEVQKDMENIESKAAKEIREAKEAGLDVPNPEEEFDYVEPASIEIDFEMPVPAETR
jgi:NhaP-type Na+/H+ or K+/H+ antiporter